MDAFPPAPAPSESTGFALSPDLETTALPVMQPPAAPEPAPFVPSDTPSFRMPPFSSESLGAEPEAGPDPVHRSRPSKEDLAALDALLNPGSTPRPLEPARPPARSGRWEPQFQSMARPRRPPRRQTPPLLLVAAAAGVIAVIGGGSWYYLTSQKAPPPPTPRPVVRASAAPTVVPATPTPAPTQALPEGVPTAAATASPLPVPSPSTATPAPPPSPAVATSTSPLDSGPVTDARSLMRSGSFGPAAQGFADNVRAAVGSPFTIQLLVACSTETVQKALEQVAADDLYILPVSYKGRSCHRVCWGLYGSEAGASSALPALPDYFRQNGATPKVVRTATLLR
jgi:hypothetical protein